MVNRLAQILELEQKASEYLRLYREAIKQIIELESKEYVGKIAYAVCKKCKQNAPHNTRRSGSLAGYCQKCTRECAKQSKKNRLNRLGIEKSPSGSTAKPSSQI